jgi:nitrogen fixation protein FixH
MPTELPVRKVASTEGITGRHVLIAIVAFFGVVFAVNAYFIRAALSTHTGVVANEPYRKGLKYNERIAEGEQQALLGWRDEIALSPDGQALTVRLVDKNGAPVRGLAVKAILGRPATTAEDAVLPLVENDAGRYEAATGLREPGGYIASIEVSNSAGEGAAVVYRARTRLWQKP